MIGARRFWLRSSCGAVLVLACAASVNAQPKRAGTHHDADILTPQFYSGPADGKETTVWRYELQHPDATYIAIHFVDFDLAPGDVLIVSDADGGQLYTMKGLGKMEAGTFWGQHIKGDTAVLELISTSAEGGYGFVIDEYVAGFIDMGPFGAEDDGLRAICGTGDFENAVCYQTSHPTEYDRGRAVARILFNGSGWCTGWLASGQSHFFTNEHCISSQSDATSCDFEFMSEAPTCGTANCPLCHVGPTVVSGATFIMDNSDYDFALLQLPGNPAQTYGYLELDNRVAIPGEEIYIVQHPDARAKEFAIFSTHASDAPSGLAHVFSITEAPCSGSGFNDVGYYADTEGGSSGSPVLARSSHKVIALHHCANCPNRGVPIHLIYPIVESFLTPGPAGAVTMDAAAYNCADTATIKLRDGDLLGAGSQAVSVSVSSGDSESMTLTETGASTGVFTGSVATTAGAPNPSDGTLQVSHGDVVTVTYNDADNGTGNPAAVQATAVIDCVAPMISSVAAGASGPVATVSFQTDEAACGVVHYGLSGGALDQTVAGDCGETSHTIIFSGLDPLATYLYSVEATDDVGNAGSDDNAGVYYSFDTPDFVFFFYDDFATTTIDSINWTTITGAPAIDAIGIGEPTEPYSLRLNGDPSGGEAVESRIINLSGKTGLELRYWYEQTGGGESPDSGDDLFVEYLNASATWVQLAMHAGTDSDMTVYAETVIELPPAAYYAGFRFRIRNTASSGAFDDWFVDDVVIQPMPPAPPSATGVSGIETDQDVSVDIVLTGSDPNGDPLDYIITTLPSIGTLSDPNAGTIAFAPYALAAGGDTVTYTPSPGLVGADAFLFKVNDGTFDSNTVSVSLFVFAPAPVITSTSPLPDGAEGVPYGPVQLLKSGGQPEVLWSQVTDLLYSETDLGTNGFAEVGVAQAWNGDDRYWNYNLPFTFPYYGANYTTLRIWSNGFLNFGAHTGSSYGNSDPLLIDNRRIAPLWEDLKTTDPGNDIFIDESAAGIVTIRWNAAVYNGAATCNFSVALHESGDIAFHYGSGNDPVTATLGISNGNGSEYTLSMRNGLPPLSNTNSVLFELVMDLPDGVTIDTNGVLAGTPTESGSFEAVFKVTDSLGRSDQKPFTLYVAPFGGGDNDFNGDGHVDLADFGALQVCFTGDGMGPATAGCDVFYADPDSDVDLIDFAAFAAQLGGP